MKCLSIFMLFIISLCHANGFVCEFFNEISKSLEKYCRNFDGRNLPENCHQQEIDDALERFEVRQLVFAGCDNETVLSGIKAYKNVHALDISYSAYQSLDWLMEVQIFERLEKFIGAHNQIKEIPSNFGALFPELIEIDLSHNEIAVINRTNGFKGAKKLLKVDLSYNAISIIESEVFADSPDLKYIDLRGNNLQGVPVFSVNQQLKTIHLENNKIINYDCSYMSMESSISVYVSWQWVYVFDNYHSCKGKQMHVVATSSFEGVVISPNGTAELHCKPQSFSKLMIFHAAPGGFDNAIEMLPCFGSSILIMILSGNFIGSFNPRVLNSFSKLQRLELKDTMLTDFDLTHLKHKQSLLALDLSHNNLTNINGIEWLWNLEELDISFNHFTNTTEMIEQFPPNLTYLDLSGNTVGELDANTFDRLTELQILKLSNTNLSIIDFNPFEELNNLFLLDISHNNLSNVNFTMLSTTLIQLIHFNAAECHIKNATNVIQHLGSFLTKLNLSGNFIGKLDAHTFQWLFNIEDLNLSNTNISELNPFTLKNQKNLFNLDLSYNKLKEIDFDLLSGKLETINLEGNELKKIELYTPTLPQKISLGLAKNHLPCRFLKKLKHDIPRLRYIGDPLQQKHGNDCNSTGQGINDFLNSVYGKIKFW